MARIGSVAAAPFVGDQFASLYLGNERVPTVPGRPVITAAIIELPDVSITGTEPNDGGEDIQGYNLYINGVLKVEENANIDVFDLSEAGEVPISEGDLVRISAVNAIGEGPLSIAVAAT
jgi:hypothetical protein